MSIRKRVAILAAVVVVGVVGVGVIALKPFTPSVAWAYPGVNARPLDATTSQTATDIEVHVANQWPAQEPPGGWLDPAVIDTPWAIVVTLHPTDAYRAMIASGPVGSYDTGGWVKVHLAEPLDGRPIYDGSSFPPADRPLR